MSKVCTFYIITPFYRLCTQMLGGINYYDSLFFKTQILKQLLYFLKKQDFEKYIISLINKINKVCTFYIITPFYTLWTQLVRGRY